MMKKWKQLKFEIMIVGQYYIEDHFVVNNLNNCKNKFFLVFFHNLKRYDSYLIIVDPKSTKMLRNQNIRVKNISSNTKKFLSFSYIKNKSTQNSSGKRPDYYEIRFLHSS